MPSVHVVVTKEVSLEKQEEWLKMADELATETWKEAGCIAYSFVISDSSPTRFFIIEEWASQAHLQAHFETEHFKRLVPLMDGISEMPALDVCKSALSVSRARKGNILVLYDSASSSTEKMADLVAEGVNIVEGMELRVRCVPGDATTWEAEGRSPAHPYATFEDLNWADGVACGTPTNLGCISWRMKKFWDDFSQQGYWSKIDGKIGVSFSSQGGHGGGAELVCMAMNTILQNCGFLIPGITDYVGFKNTLHYGAVCAKAPRDDLDKMACRRLGTRLAEFVGLLILGRKELNPLETTKQRDMDRWGFPGIPPRDAPAEELLALNTAPVDPIAAFGKN